MKEFAVVDTLKLEHRIKSLRDILFSEAER